MVQSSEGALSAASLRHYWQQNYSDCPPVGYLLRQQFHDRWTRIHTLPGAKRYANSDSEEREILRRHNALLSSVVGDGGRYVLVTTGYSAGIDPVRSYPELQLERIGGPNEWWLTVARHEIDEEEYPTFWHFFFAAGDWKAGSSDNLLRLVAEDTVANVLLVDIECHSIYHPYDGGADIFTSSDSFRDLLKRDYRDWLSDRPDGL